MNINSNELLLLKKIRFGEGQETAKPQTNVIPNVEGETPQTGMNALTFEAMNNLMAEPELAQKLGVMKDAPEQKENAEGFVTPYQSNIAFQGKAGKLKNFGLAALMALTTLAGASTMTSCTEEGDTIDNSQINVNQSATVNIDMTVLQSLIDEIKGLREDMAKQNEEMAKKYDQLLNMMTQIMTMMQDQQLTNEAFQSLVLANQQIMIDIMVSNGMKQEEANKKLDDILKAVENGNMSAQQALQEITKLLGNISAQLGTIIQDLKEHFKNDEVVNSYLEKIYESSKENSQSQTEVKEVLDKLYSAVIKLGEQGDAMGKEVLKYIAAVGFEMNRNFGELIDKIGNDPVKLDEVIALLKELNSNVEKNGEQGKQMGNEILNYIAAVGFEMNRNFGDLINKIGNDPVKLDEVIALLKELNANVKQNGEEGKQMGNQILEYIAAVGLEMNKNFEALINKVGNDPEKLDEAIALLKELNSNVEKNGEQGKQMGNEILNYIAAVGFEMNRNFGDLINKIGNDPVKLDEVIALLKELNANVKQNGEEGKQMGNQILEYIAAVGLEMNKNFEALINKVGNDPEKLDEAIALLKELNANVKQNGEDGKKLGNQILEYLAKIGLDMNNNFKTVLEVINNGAPGSETIRDLLQKVLDNQDKNTQAIIEAMGNIKIDAGNIDLSGIEKMLADLLKQAEKNGDILANIDAKADVINLTIETAKAEILEKLGKNDDNAKDILAKLDAFMELSNGNTDAILKKMDTIINILNNIKDKTYDDSALMAKLDDVLAAIKDHNITVDITGKVTCNCNCGGNHEGILGALENILG